jgi:hypothetical protein
VPALGPARYLGSPPAESGLFALNAPNTHDWDKEADAVLDAAYKRVAAAFDVRRWPIPGPGDDAHQAALEEACRRRDLAALRRAAWRYIHAAESFARALAAAVPVDKA